MEVLGRAIVSYLIFYLFATHFTISLVTASYPQFFQIMNALIFKATYTQKEKSNIIDNPSSLYKKKAPTDSGVAQAVTVSSFQEELSERFVTPFSTVGVGLLFDVELQPPTFFSRGSIIVAATDGQ
ncbi:hypothetical protein J1N35_015524 [Gossypium stocksii]|uniref:Uncharacterized protein n=1 Tax=Gossypium stocksii TaxID=47602 RepID=A0A9D3VWW3_9ROSI|nr:hypothetical protein J1N35_015524 [Gossypium stocksii]